jgi:hypothetical protein
MALPTTYTQETKVLPDFFGKLRDAQAPSKFTLQNIKDFGYKSNNHRAFLPILKALGFLTADGTPTLRYHNYRNHALSKVVMGEAVKETYSDIFLIKAKPSSSDKALIEGKFKSYHNVSDTVAGLMTKTFYALLDMADLDGASESTRHYSSSDTDVKTEDEAIVSTIKSKSHSSVGLHYNIQIHLPATKDVEVYNAIFKSLKDHLIE